MQSMPKSVIADSIRAVELGFLYKTYVLGYLKSLKNTKSPVWVLKVFILCNLINKPRIQSSVLICEIH